MDTNQVEKSLSELLEDNTGYNPENVADHGDYELIGAGKVLLVNDRTYLRTDAMSVQDYIQHYPRQFGLILAGRFFVAGEV